ncbi:MAG TPA: AAA family ATPase [Nocardioidaceae bacterium]|nr:AAA family ATPase [Nocardioidaceae bacterium]
MLQSAIPLVGRDAELARLTALLDAAQAGQGGGAVLLGEAGIGKTSLVEAVASEAVARGFVVAWGRSPDVVAAPYWPWRQVLGGLGIAEPFGTVPSGGRAELFGEVLGRLERVDRPAVTILDDVHRADEGSLELLSFVASQLQGTRVVLLLTSRDDGIDLSGLAAETLAALPARVLRIELEGLDRDDTATLVRGLDPHASDELVAAVQRRTGGNPFFASEVARLHAAREKQGVASGSDVPTAVQHVLSRRLARIDQHSVRLLEVAAVVGRPDVALLCAVTGLQEQQVLELLEEPLQARILVGAGRELRFAHDLVRETLYAGLSEAGRARLHATVAEAAPVEDAISLAEHWARVHGPEARARAAEHALQAAAQAQDLMAHEQAARYYAWALGDGVGDPVGVRLGLGRAQVLAGDVDAGRVTLAEAASEAIAAGRGAEAVQAVLAMGTGLGGFEVDIGDARQRHLLSAALVLLPEGDHAMRAAGLARLSLLQAPTASIEERAALANEAIAIARRLHEPGVEAAALAALNDALSGPDHVQERLEGANRIVAIADAADDTALALLGLRLRLLARLEVGDLAGVDSDIHEYDRRAQKLRLPLYTWPVPLWTGMRAQMKGDGERAMCCADEVEKLGREAGSTNAALMAFTMRLHQAKAEEDPVGLASLLEEVSRFGIWDPSQWDCCLASIYAYMGVLDQARFHLDRVVASGLDSVPKDAEWLELLWQVAEASLVLADKQVARAIHERLTPYSDLYAVDGIGGAVFGRVSEILGRIDAFLADERLPEHPTLLDVSESGELRREGRVWQVGFRGRHVTVPHSKGMTDLAALVSRPGREVHVLDLVEAAGGPRRREAGGDTGPVLDREARHAYERRLAELDDDIAEAEQNADLGRMSSLTGEREFLLAELAGATGLGGRDRVSGDRAERARKAVTMRISTALKAIAEAHPELARHLSRSVSTGRFCCYRPERPVTWRT